MLLWVYLDGVYEKLEDKYKADVINHNKLQYSIIERNLLNTKKDIKYISSLYKYINDEQKYLADDKKEIFTNSIVRLMNSKKVYSQVRFLDISGQEIVRVDYKNAQCEVIDNAKLQNKSSRYYFQESLTLKEDEIYISKFDLNKENSKIEVPYNPTMRLSTPVTNIKNEIVGYIIINYLGKEILDEIVSQDKAIKTLLLNKESYYLLGFNKEEEWGFMFDNNINFKGKYPYLWNEAKEKESFTLHYKNTEFSFLLINPVEIVSPDREVESRRMWKLVSYISHDKIWEDLFAYIDSIKFLLVGFIFAILVFSYVISIYIRKEKEAHVRMEIADEVFNNTIEGVMVLDAENKILQVNKAFTTITGYKEEEILNKNPRVLKGKFGESKEYYKKMWDAINEENYWHGELINQNKNGEKYISKLSVGTVNRDGMVLYYIGVFSDITKERESKDKLKRTADALEKSLSELKSAQNKLVESEKLTALGQLIAGISHEINSPLGAIKSSSENVLDSIENILIDIPLLDKALSQREKELFKSLKESIPFEISVLSIKEQRTLKKKLKEQFESMGIENSRFYADKFSQFNIEDITEFKDLILHKEAKLIIDALFSEYLIVSNVHNIKRSVDRASKTIFALKKFAHFDHDRDGSIEKLEDLVNNTLILFSHNLKQGVAVVKEYKDLDAIFCYSDELSQVWMNLISNAIHAMDNNGTLTVRLDEDEAYQIVSIIDTGIGIPLEIQEKIFEPFFTTKKSGEGSGLGLDIVHKIIEAHDGKIELNSDENGTMFKIYISKNIEG